MVMLWLLGILVLGLIITNFIIDVINKNPPLLYHFTCYYKYNSEYDKAMQLCLAKYKEGLITVKLYNGTLKFSDKTNIVVSEKYHGYGRFTYYLGSDEYFKPAKVSMSTFKQLYDVEMSLRTPSMVKEKYI